MKNLLILGAGGYGRTIRELAQAMGCFDAVAFLDDKGADALILGPCVGYAQYAGRFAFAYPAFGDNVLRAAWLPKLAAAGFAAPRLIHPRAYLSPSAQVEDGAAVLALAAVNANSVVRAGAIVNLGAIVDHDCVIGACAHLAPGAVVKAGNHVPAQQKIDSGVVLARK